MFWNWHELLVYLIRIMHVQYCTFFCVQTVCLEMINWKCIPTFAPLCIKTNLDDFPTNNSVHDHYTRQHTFLRPQQCNFKTAINSFCEVGKRMYNLLPSNIKCLSTKCFKKSIVSMLCSVSVYDVQEFVDHLLSLKK